MSSKQSRGRFSGLLARITITIVIVSMLVLTGFGAFDYLSARKQMISELQNLATMLSQRLSKVLVIPVWNVNTKSVLDILESEMADPRLAALVVHDETGQNIFAGLQRINGALAPYTKGTDPDSVVSVRNRLDFDTFSIGSVTVQVFKKHLKTQLRQQLFVTVARSLILGILLVLFLLVIIRRHLLDPILDLSQAAKSISNDSDYIPPMPVQSGNELGELAESFNTMLARIQNRERILKEHMEHLEDLVNERTRELERAKKIAEDANRAKSRFLANMSSEIRTPINAIIGMADIARRTQLTAKQKEYLNIIKSSSQSLLELINQILDYSEIEAGNLNLDRVPLNLWNLLDEVADLFRSKVADQGIELILDVTSTVPESCLGDPLRLRQVLVNLVSNAFKFTEHGEVAIEVRLVEENNQDSVVAFSVRDTGLGMDHSEIDRIFHKVTQENESSRNSSEGGGLSLSICKKLVELMGGDITVESRKGYGSRFTFTARLGKIEYQPARDPALNLANDSLKALIVDDNRSNSTVLEKMLGRLGIEAQSVASGEEALDLLKNGGSEFNVVFLDWRLPGIDGLEVFKQLRSQGDPSFTVVMMTAFGREDLVAQAEALGIQAFLIKPIKAKSLRDTMLEILGLTPPPPQSDFIGKPLPDLTGAHVLLVEDNIIDREVALEWLNEAGLVVDVAVNGNDALAALKEHAYDVVLLDVKVPEMAGLDTARAIRAAEKHDLPIIAMTAHAIVEDRDQCLEAGMNDLLPKPLNRQMLFKALTRWVRLNPA